MGDPDEYVARSWQKDMKAEILTKEEMAYLKASLVVISQRLEYAVELYNTYGRQYKVRKPADPFYTTRMEDLRKGLDFSKRVCKFFCPEFYDVPSIKTQRDTCERE